ncbi:DUF6930 domain-containing protein [Synechococcus sp. H70.2]|uniref:DUF6930 domain-containing protein n=1 Tax=unclassified Synechococcus TaxID=2626047 RepID=UPI0039C227C6
MSGLPAATVRRLQKLPQIPSVWEGDRHRLPGSLVVGSQTFSSLAEGECILWVDGVQGVVRAMEVVPAGSGMEPIVRALIAAMERPNGALPARPQKIVVRDREVQFFLRGILHELNIKVEYQPELPLIEEILQSFAEAQGQIPPPLPEDYAELVAGKALAIWQDAPWEYLEDHQILAIELHHWDIETLYVSVLGRSGREYGVLFYRSLSSLKQFRQQAGQVPTPEMEEAFLRQDCLYLTFQPRHPELEDLPDLDLAELDPEEIEPNFGTIHPLEGLRVTLQEEEAATLAVALEALHRFLKQYRRKLEKGFQPCQGQYCLPNPQREGETLPVQVRTLPDVAAELLALEAEDEKPTQALLRDDLLPEGAQLGLGLLPWATVEVLRRAGQVHPLPQSKLVQRGEGLPVVIVRTSRSKAKQLIENLRSEGGPQGVCFNTGVDPFDGHRYELEIVQTGNCDLHLFGEFPEDDPAHSMARKRWERRCRDTGGCCGLVIAMGANSQQAELPVHHILALFEMQVLSPKRLGLGPMVRVSRHSGVAW